MLERPSSHLQALMELGLSQAQRLPCFVPAGSFLIGISREPDRYRSAAFLHAQLRNRAFQISQQRVQ